MYISLSLYICVCVCNPDSHTDPDHGSPRLGPTIGGSVRLPNPMTHETTNRGIFKVTRGIKPKTSI